MINPDVNITEAVGIRYIELITAADSVCLHTNSKNVCLDFTIFVSHIIVYLRNLLFLFSKML